MSGLPDGMTEVTDRAMLALHRGAHHEAVCAFADAGQLAGAAGVFSALYTLASVGMQARAAAKGCTGSFVITDDQGVHIEELEPAARAAVRFVCASGNDDHATAAALFQTVAQVGSDEFARFMRHLVAGLVDVWTDLPLCEDT